NACPGGCVSCHECPPCSLCLLSLAAHRTKIVPIPLPAGKVSSPRKNEHRKADQRMPSAWAVDAWGGLNMCQKYRPAALFFTCFLNCKSIWLQSLRGGMSCLGRAACCQKHREETIDSRPYIINECAGHASACTRN
ncbi:unnamed protein product, partial [Ectocarpus sp. 8 AP-2014]